MAKINQELAAFTNAVVMVGTDVDTFYVRHKVTRQRILVDGRTFDPSIHESLDAPAPVLAEPVPPVASEEPGDPTPDA